MAGKTKRKWTLLIGSHKGSLASCVNEDPIPDLESFEACVVIARKIKRGWDKRGKKKLWYATALGPDGRQSEALEGLPDEP